MSLSYLFASNLTSCVSCAQVSCPAGTTCHNIGSCPNGFVLWGCVYPNGTVVSKSIPGIINTTIPTTSTAISKNITTSISSNVTRPPLQNSTVIYNTTNTTYYLVLGVIVIIVVIGIVYYIYARKKV